MFLGFLHMSVRRRKYSRDRVNIIFSEMLDLNKYFLNCIPLTIEYAQQNLFAFLMEVNTLWAEPCLICWLPNPLAPAQCSLAKFAEWMSTGLNSQLGARIDPVLHISLSSVMASVSALMTFSSLLYLWSSSFFFLNKILFTNTLNYLFQKCIETINPETVISCFLYMIVLPNNCVR